MGFNFEEIKDYSKPYIIAELGANHNGDMELARKMIREAKACGAQCVKFQSWTKDTIFSKKVYDDNYFLKDDYRNRDDYTLEEIVDKFSVGEKELFELKKYCDEVQIDFSSTPFSKKEVDFLVDVLDVDFIKIASMDLNNYPFLEYIARKGKPIVLSVGLSTLAEIDEAVRRIKNTGNDKIIILHCVSIYPPEDREVNLNNIDMLRDLYKYPTGYSDHTLGITAAILAVGKGSCIIEKHFTLDNDMFGWDHKISANPTELKIIVDECNRAYKMLGNYYKEVNESEERKAAFRRSVVVTRDIKKGEIINEEDLDFKRPGTGLPPDSIKFIIGKTCKRDLAVDEMINMEDF